MLTLKSFIDRHWFLYENRCFECKHRARARVQRGARPAARRNIRQYVSNINIRVSLMRGTNICILWLYILTFVHTRLIFRKWYSSDINRPVQAMLMATFRLAFYYPQFSPWGKVFSIKLKQRLLNRPIFSRIFLSERRKTSIRISQICNMWNPCLLLPPPHPSLPLRKYIINILYRRNTVIAPLAFIESVGILGIPSPTT